MEGVRIGTGLPSTITCLVLGVRACKSTSRTLCSCNESGMSPLPILVVRRAAAPAAACNSVRKAENGARKNLVTPQSQDRGLTALPSNPVLRIGVTRPLLSIPTCCSGLRLSIFICAHIRASLDFVAFWICSKEKATRRFAIATYWDPTAMSSSMLGGEVR
jgi:hypothetical protein